MAKSIENIKSLYTTSDGKINTTKLLNDLSMYINLFDDYNIDKYGINTIREYLGEPKDFIEMVENNNKKRLEKYENL